MNRPNYPTKAAWAAAQARDLYEKAAALPLVPASNWRGVRRRAAGMDHMRREARRFEQLAERLAAQGR